MVSVTKYPSNVSQTTLSSDVPFDNLENIKNNVEGSWAVSRTLIKGHSQLKCVPSTIKCKGFNFNLPLGAEPTKVIVYYRHRKVAGNDYSAKYPKRICNIGAPLIMLQGLELKEYDEVNPTNFYGVAPKADGMHTQTKTFKLTNVNRSKINSSNFGVHIVYPPNSNEYDGYMRISFVRIAVEYKLSSYTVGVKRTSGGYNREPYTVQLSISNRNRTNYNPSLTLSSPPGFSFESCKGTGVLSQNSVSSFTWNPKLSSKVGTSSMNVTFTPDVSYPSGEDVYTGTFTLSESLNGAYNSFVASISEKPTSSGDETSPDASPIITDDNSQVGVKEWNKLVIDEEVSPRLNIEEDLQEWCVFFAFPVTSDGEIIIPDTSPPLYYRGPYDAWTHISFKQLGEYRGIGTPFYNLTVLSIKCSDVGRYKIAFYKDDGRDLYYWSDYVNDTPLYEYYIDCRPSEEDLTIPNFSILTPEQEELDRLGTTYPYIVQTYLKHETTDTYERDWYKNNRIGIFNNVIKENVTVEEIVDPETGEVTEIITDSTDYDNLTSEEIFTHAEYWSQQTGGLNDYENVECEFTYNEEYPLHILITGDYPEATTYGFDRGTVTYTEPCIIEKTVYDHREPHGNYPYPIQNLIQQNNTSAEITIPTLHQSTPIIIYDYLLEEDYGTNETLSIRGLEVNGTIQKADELVLNCKLTSPNGATGERSIILNNQDILTDNENTFKVGGLGDLWGFQTQDLTQLGDWEIEITTNNILLEDNADLNIGDLQLVIYTENIDKQNINIRVDGEDLSYYGAFITEVKIPEGLSTDTSFLTIDGTDTNDAYRQNIREKTIEIELQIGECDLQNSTDMLRQLTKLLVNDKDQYNRPIPNIIEFSHYPDVYFEYIMTETLEITNEIGAYNVKAKLTIPSGTSYSKQSTTTNITGFVQGIAAINPTITLKPTSETIQVKELMSGQEFHMGYTGDWQSKVVEIDCEDRKAYLKDNEDDTEPVDISRYVDFNSDWFTLHGEYSFSGNGCVVRTVEYTERW